jgi:glycosyltransferase involved in cell wall biosynthesis
VVRHGENGFLVPAHSTEALARAMATLIEDAPLRAKMGACGRVIAVREFSEELVHTQLLEVYRNLLEDRRAGDAVAGFDRRREYPAVSG